MKRPIAALAMPDVEPGTPPTPPPVYMMVKPEELLVDETYQRDLSEASIRLVRKIVAEWDWRKFKAPVVAMTEDGPVLIDGQHTSIGAASHPGILEIPVLVVEAAETKDQAQAFVGINTSRLGVTASQLFHANVAAGDPSAVTIDRVCVGAGVRVLRLPPARAIYKVGETIAVQAIGGMIARSGEAVARRVLDILVAAEVGPIQAAHMRAVERLITDPEFAELDADDVARVIAGMGLDAAERDAKVFASTHCVPLWRALASTWFKARGKARRRSVDPSSTPLVTAPRVGEGTPSPTTAASITASRNAARSRHAEIVEAARRAIPAPNFSGPGRAGR